MDTVMAAAGMIISGTAFDSIGLSCKFEGRSPHSSLHMCTVYSVNWGQAISLLANYPNWNGDTYTSGLSKSIIYQTRCLRQSYNFVGILFRRENRNCYFEAVLYLNLAPVGCVFSKCIISAGQKISCQLWYFPSATSPMCELILCTVLHNFVIDKHSKY